MLHKAHVRRGWYAACIGTFAAAWFAVLATWSVFAAGVVVQGYVTNQDTTAVSGVFVELHTTDRNFSAQTVTDSSGHYSFSDTLVTAANYVVEISPVHRYIRIEPSSNIFTYLHNDPVRLYSFHVTELSNSLLIPRNLPNVD